MNLYKQFKTDATLETAGVFLDYGTNSKGKPIRFKIARAGGKNDAYSKALEKATRPHRIAMQNKTFSNEQADALVLDVFCEAVLLGWEGVENEAGEAVSYDKAAARKLMNDLPDLYADIRGQADAAATFRQQELEADLKN